MKFAKCAGQDHLFRKAVKDMYVLYAHDATFTLRIESLTVGLHDGPLGCNAALATKTVRLFHVPAGRVVDLPLKELRITDNRGRCSEACGRSCPYIHANPTPYCQRAWCCAEDQWSLLRAAAWRCVMLPLISGPEARAPMTPEDFRKFAQDGHLRFICGEDLEPLFLMHAKVFRARAGRAEELELMALPVSEVLVLCRSLRHFRKLRALRLHRCQLGGAAAKAFCWLQGRLKTFYLRMERKWQKLARHFADVMSVH